ncbi:MAG: major capsid protein [Sneathiella sp.]
MASFDIFDGDGFSMMSLTQRVNHMPTTPNRIQAMGLFKAQGVSTTTIAVEEKNAELSLVQTSERGSPASEGKKPKRKLRHFEIPHLKRNARLMADEVQNIRAFGTMSEPEVALQQFEERVALRRQEMDLTIERMELSTICGKLTDANDEIIYDYYNEFKVMKPADVSFAFSTITQANSDKAIINAATTKLKRRLKKALSGMATGSMQIGALCGDNFFDKLVNNAETRTPYQNWRAAEQLSDRNLAHDSFKYGGVTWENYDGDTDGKVKIGEEECRFFVKGVPGLFDIYFGPADTLEFVNTRGLPLYALPYRDPKNKFWEAEVQTNPLPMCTRPKSLERGIAA